MARAEILEIFLLFFWKIWRHIKDILISTDLCKYYSQNNLIFSHFTLFCGCKKWNQDVLMVFFCILGKGLICCGDDKGSLWLYNLPQFGRDSPNPALKTKIDVSTRLMWPELQVSFLEFTLINSLLKFIFSEKATNFCEISTVNLSYVKLNYFKKQQKLILTFPYLR